MSGRNPDSGKIIEVVDSSYYWSLLVSVSFNIKNVPNLWKNVADTIDCSHWPFLLVNQMVVLFNQQVA